MSGEKNIRQHKEQLQRPGSTWRELQVHQKCDTEHGKRKREGKRKKRRKPKPLTRMAKLSDPTSSAYQVLKVTNSNFYKFSNS